MGQSSAPSAVRRTPMLRRITTIVALAILAALLVVSPARADHNTAHTIEQLTAHYQDPALETQNKPFAMLYLGINAHVNNDLAFMIEAVGPRYLYPDHKHVDDVLAFRAYPAAYPEIQRDLCPGLFSETVPLTADRGIFAWRELAWDNAQRLLSAPTPQAREAIAEQIRQHAQDKAREIIRWYR